MKVALVGNQNCGKTTLFNLLTGSNQKIGNWPGVTIERKSGIIKGTDHELIDLPGIYSLSPYSEEEKISRDFVVNGEVDLIINVIDATSIERSLYLTTQLMELDIPIVLVLNMIDLTSKKGIKIDKEKLEKEIKVKVVEASALKNVGIDELISIINSNNSVSNIKVFDGYLEEKISLISDKLSCKHKRFYSVKVLEEDEISKKYKKNFISEIELIKENYNVDLIEVIANERYEFIEKIKNNCVKVEEVRESVSDKLDKVFLNKWLSLPIFSLIMFAIYYLSVGVIGSATVDMVDSFVGSVGKTFGEYLNDIGTSSWLISLIVDGIIAGVGAVLNFVPQLTILFLCISLLETSGYMSRISFFLDMIFKKFGLSGKTLVPFIVGSGCSVPGIMATRTIENKSEREMSIILTPFIPCSAKLPIIALFAGYFFPNKSGVFSASLYFMAIFIILVLALILKKIIYKDEVNSFISELPEYKLPSFKYVFRDVLEKVGSFIKRAGSVILLASIVIWFMLSFSFSLEYGVNVENSILAGIGKSLSWIFYPILGEFSWEATVSAIQGLVAKEQVVGSMAIIANMSEESLDSASLFNSEVFGFFSGASAYAYVAFNLFSAPCFGAIGAMKKEFGSSKKTFLAIVLQMLVAWIVAVAIRAFGLLIGG